MLVCDKKKIVTGLLLACFVVIFTYHSCFLVFNKKICLRKVKNLPSLNVFKTSFHGKDYLNTL